MAPEHRRAGIATALVMRLARTLRPGERLATSAPRENTAEGEALLESLEARHGLDIERIDEGLDGRW